MVEQIMTVIITVFASTGFWSFVNYLLQRRDNDNSLLLALACDRIVTLAEEYEAKGYVTKDDYDRIMHLYIPYKEKGGNSVAQKVMQDKVEKLEFRTI